MKHRPLRFLVGVGATLCVSALLAAAGGDADGDGIPDTDDDCPNVAGPGPTGCPKKDSDGDGLWDGVDSCPHEAEDPNGFQDGDGCPDDPDLVEKGGLVQLRKPLTYQKDRTSPPPEVQGVFKNVTRWFKNDKRSKSVEVVITVDPAEGKRGKAEALAQDRADGMSLLLGAAGFRPEQVITRVERVPAKGGTLPVRGIQIRIVLGTGPRPQATPEGTASSSSSSEPAPAGAASTSGVKPATASSSAGKTAVASSSGKAAGKAVSSSGKVEATGSSAAATHPAGSSSTAAPTASSSGKVVLSSSAAARPVAASSSSAASSSGVNAAGGSSSSAAAPSSSAAGKTAPAAAASAAPAALGGKAVAPAASSGTGPKPAAASSGKVDDKGRSTSVSGPPPAASSGRSAPAESGAGEEPHPDDDWDKNAWDNGKDPPPAKGISKPPKKKGKGKR